MWMPHVDGNVAASENFKNSYILWLREWLNNFKEPNNKNTQNKQSLQV